MAPVLLLAVILLLLAVAAAFTAITLRNLLGCVMMMGIYSLLLAVIWADLFAMDVSITEASIGAGASTILLLMALTRTGTRERKSGDHSLPALIVVVLTGLVLIQGTSEMPRFGDPEAPAHRHVAPQYLAQQVPKVAPPSEATDPAPQPAPVGEDEPGNFGHHVPNTVTAVLAAYRGYDTMFETVVIFSAGMCLLLLLRPLPRKREESIDE
jgi:multicomponent Na+:H+ antiporter subunit B